jgi:glycosyltransferase involved in cell wall biosynthesis
MISVVIPLYNKARHIGRAVNSVLDQSYRELEIVVVDDGSTDNGVEIVESLQDMRIRVSHQANAGVSAARNLGISECRADIVAFLDADDEWRPGFPDTIVRLSKTHPECGAYATAYDIVDDDGRRWSPRFNGVPEPPWEGILPNYFRSAMTGPVPVCASSVAVPKRVFSSVGLFAVGESFGEDVDLWARIALRFRIAFSSTSGAVYYRDSDNRACNRPGPCEHPVIKTLETAIRSGDLPAWIPREDIIEYKNRRRIYCAGTCLDAGLPAEARAYLRAANSSRSLRRAWWYYYSRSLVPPALLKWARGAKRHPESTPRV